MAKHKVLVTHSYDCDVLNVISLQDGKGNAIEYAHYESLDDFHRNPITGAIAMEFDDRGLFELLNGDGKLGPDLMDYSTNQWGNIDYDTWKWGGLGWSPRRNWSDVTIYDSKFVSADRQIDTIIPEGEQNWTKCVLDAQGNIFGRQWLESELYSVGKMWVFNSATGLWAKQDIPAEGVYSVAAPYIVGSYGVTPICAFGDFAVMYTSIGGNDWAFVAAKKVGGEYVPIHAPILETVPYGGLRQNGNFDRNMSCGYSLAPGKFFLTYYGPVASGDYFYADSGLTRVASFSLSDVGFSCTAETYQTYFWDCISAVNSLIHMNPNCVNGLVKPEGTEVIQDPQFQYNTVQPTFTMSSLIFNADGVPVTSFQSYEVPVALPEGWHSNGSGSIKWIEDKGNGTWDILTVSFYVEKTDPDTGNTLSGVQCEMRVYNLNLATGAFTPLTGVLQVQKTAEWAEIDIPARTFDYDEGIITEMQPYKVEGYVKKDGTGLSTDVILIDNETQRIIGRTKSDPSTGYYYFRCWSNSKKSVHAVHPVSKGLRIAAEVQPTPEA